MRIPKCVLSCLLFAIVSPLSRAAEAPPSPGPFTNLGPQLSATTLIGTTFAKDPAGHDLVCTVMRGQPAKLVVFDLRTGDVLKLLPLPGADGAWNATTASDGSVYAGTDSNGHLYRWVPGEEAVQDLGQIPGQRWVWDVEPGRDGEVFASTYPDARVFRYHPADGFKDLTQGQPISPNEQYARALAYDAVTGKIYVGVGSHAHLVELDPATGKRTELLPKEYANQEFVYGANVFGRYLFACVTNKNISLVFNLETRKFDTILPAMTGQQVMTKSPTDDKVYYTVNNHLYSFDYSKPSEPPAELLSCPAAIGMSWLRESPSSDPKLILFTAKANLITYDPKTGKSSSKSFKTPSEPVVIQSIHLGPDGRIWTGGYLSGGNAAYDPATNKSVQYKGLSQSESIADLGPSLYFGIYPHGRFATYDTSKPWNTSKSNPKQLGAIEGQSRPFAGLGVPELNRVFFGTIPEYGILGGGIAEVDPATSKLSFHPVIKDHSVTSLTYANHLLVGGTSIWGGLGAKPTETTAKLFLWDPATHEKVFETTPVEGASAITALISGPDHNIWGVAAGTLFIFDPASRQVLSRHKLFDVDYAADQHVWRDATLLLHPNGQIYGTLNRKLFRLDPNTKQVTVLRDQNADLLAMDRQGRLYFHDTINLWQYQP